MRPSRRYRVRQLPDLTGHEPTQVNQAYLFAADGWAVGVRRVFHPEGETVRAGANTLGLTGPGSPAQDWDITAEAAQALFLRASAKVFASRYRLVAGGEPWVLDVYQGANDGLAIAAGAVVPTPTWCDEEVTGDRRFDEENLARQPWTAWS